MSNRPLALLVFGTALVASVATSPITWQIGDDVSGAPVTLDDAQPETSLYIDVTSAGIPDRAWGSLYVTVVVEQSVATADEALTLDFVLVQETQAGDVAVDEVTGWTLGPATEENPSPSTIALYADDIPEVGTWRVDVTQHAPGSTSFTWGASALFEIQGEDEVRGDPSLDLTLTPAR